MYTVKITCTICGRDSCYPNTLPEDERFCSFCFSDEMALLEDIFGPEALS